MKNEMKKEKDYEYSPKSKDELIQLIKERINVQGHQCSLNDIDVSEITDMSMLFKESPFNGDISKWDVSHVKDMVGMFYKSPFTGDISQWKIHEDTDVSFMLEGCPLGDNPLKWYKSLMNS